MPEYYLNLFSFPSSNFLSKQTDAFSEPRNRNSIFLTINKQKETILLCLLYLMKRMRHVRINGRNRTESALERSKRVTTNEQHIVKITNRFAQRQGLKWKRLRRGRAIWVRRKPLIRSFTR